MLASPERPCSVFSLARGAFPVAAVPRPPGDSPLAPHVAIPPADAGRRLPVALATAAPPPPRGLLRAWSGRQPIAAPRPEAVAALGSGSALPEAPAGGGIPAREAILRALFSPLTLEERYRRLMAMGRGLPAYPAGSRHPGDKVPGCQSTVYLRAKGLVALVLFLYDGQLPEDILRHDPSSLQALGVVGSLSPTRAQGLASVVQHVKRLALRRLVDPRPTPHGEP